MQAVISYFIGLDEHILALAYLFAAVIEAVYSSKFNAGQIQMIFFIDIR